MIKTIATVLICVWSMALNAQNYRVKAGSAKEEKPFRLHEGFIGEDASSFFVLELRQNKATTLRPRMIVTIRAYDKVSMKMQKELALEDLYDLKQLDEKVFIGARVLGDQLALVWDHPKETKTKITWVSLRSLTRSKKETLLFDFSDGYQSKNNLMLLKKDEPCYSIRLDYSKDMNALLVSSLEVDPKKGSKFTIKKVDASGATPEVVGSVSTTTNLQELAFTWKVLKGSKGTMGIYLHVPLRKNEEYKELQPGLFVAPIDVSTKKGSLQLLATYNEEYPRWRYITDDGILYLVGANIKEKTPNFFVATLDIENIPSFEINSTVFPPEAHAQLRSVNDYDKYLQKAAEGKNYFTKNLALGTLRLSKDKDILFSMSQQPIIVHSEDVETNWQYGDILIGCISTKAEVKWTKGMKRKMKEKNPQFHPVPYYVHEVVSTEQGFLILVTQPVEKLDGVNLSTVGTPSKENISIVLIKEDGTWTKESPNLDKDYRDLKVMPYAGYLLSDGTIIYAARTRGKQTYIQLMMND